MMNKFVEILNMLKAVMLFLAMTYKDIAVILTQTT